eukprot:gene13987-15447_t
MADFAFPSELSYNMLASMYPTKKSEYRRQPINTRIFTNPGEQIELILSKVENSFWDPQTLSINFTSTYLGTDVSGSAIMSAFVLGNGYSHFSRQNWRAIKNGADLETIQYPAQLCNTLHNMTIEGNSKDALAISQGYETDYGYTNFGRFVSNATQNKTQSYSIPPVGIMNTNKLIPAFVSDLQLNLTLAQLSDFMVKTIETTSRLPTGYQITKIEIVCELITLEAASMAKLLSIYPGALSLKSESFLYTNSSLPASTSGVKDITYAHSVNSLTEFIWWASPDDSLDKSYGGVNPNLASWQLIVNSTPYPSQPVKSDSPAECFYQIQKAWGSLYSAAHCGSLSRLNFPRRLTAVGEYFDYQIDAPGATEATESKFSNKFYNVIDLEIINNLNESLYSGISTKDGTHTLRLNIDTVLPSAVNIHIFSKFDVVLTFDYMRLLKHIPPKLKLPEFEVDEPLSKYLDDDPLLKNMNKSFNCGLIGMGGSAKKAGGAFEDAGDWVADTGKKVGNALEKYSGDIAMGAGLAGSGLLMATGAGLPAAGALMGASLAAGNTAQQLGSKIKQGSQQLSNVQNQVVRAFDKTGGAVNNAINSVKAGANNLQNNVRQQYNNNLQALNSNVGMARQQAQSAISNAMNNAKAQSNALVDSSGTGTGVKFV